MGKTQFDRNVHFKYTPEFIEFWRSQTQSYRDTLDKAARPYGYSGMEIFYILMWIKICEEESGKKYPFWV